LDYLFYEVCKDQQNGKSVIRLINYFAHNIFTKMHRLGLDHRFVTCENCLYSDTICAFYDAGKYCIECLCDHASCPRCNSGYHAITIVD